MLNFRICYCIIHILFNYQRLSLRQNLLTSLLVEGQAPLETLKELEEIDLYDNRISHVKGLKGLGRLRYAPT